MASEMKLHDDGQQSHANEMEVTGAHAEISGEGVCMQDTPMLSDHQDGIVVDEHAERNDISPGETVQQILDEPMDVQNHGALESISVVNSRAPGGGASQMLAGDLDEMIPAHVAHLLEAPDRELAYPRLNWIDPTQSEVCSTVASGSESNVQLIDHPGCWNLGEVRTPAVHPLFEWWIQAVLF